MAANPSPTVEVTTPSDLEITMTRTFTAPRTLVFDAWTKCEHLKHWWGPRTWILPECEIDLRPGGHWRYLMRSVDGSMEMGMHGVYQQIDHPERLVTTEYFEGDEFENMGGGTINTMVLAEDGATTTMTLTSLYRTKEDRDRVLQTGMAEGAEESLQRLDEVLAAITGGVN
jgi:uncharacterized protein YndB with AHSA1/START domain